MSQFHRFTLKAQEALQGAQDMAIRQNHGEMRSLHLLISLLSDPTTLVQPMLVKSSVNLNDLVDRAEEALASLPRIFSQTQGGGQLYLSQEVMQILDRAHKIAVVQKDDFVSCEHLFLSLLDAPTEAKRVLDMFNIKREALLKTLAQLRGSMRVTDETPEAKYQVLEKYAVNLTDRAREGKLDPVIGRDEELRRVIQILSRRTKNNPVLIGEPGVGKTAIVEGLAQRIVSQDIPETLKNKEILMLDLGSLIAGTKFRGEFEDRLRAFVKEIQKASGNIILFIDEIHTIVGAGAAEGAVDASNLLKPALARGELRAIGATTIKEYQRHIEKDAALERRFAPVLVEEPSLEDSVAILRGLKEKYEVHHGLQIRDEAIVAAVNLSARYITNRFLPDKAVDLIDEAAASRRLDTESLPKELDKVRRDIMRLEVEKQALANESKNEAAKKKRIKEIEKELKSLKVNNDELSARWHAEKISFESYHNHRQKVEQLRMEAEIAEREGNLERVAAIRYGELPQAEKELENFEKKHMWGEKKKKQSNQSQFIKEAVYEEDIAEVVSRWTGIPVTKMLETEVAKLTRAEEELGKRVIGQDESVKAVAGALRRARAGLADENRPFGSFMFLGPTGVGKTELARALAGFMFNDEKSLVRVDMSEFMERHAVSKLIGSPPGYVGFDDGGQLTEVVRHRPYSLILFDEIEKAHPEVFNILLQVLDNGHLTDSKGRVVNFKNTIIIMTSNVGSELINEMSGIGFSHLPEKEVETQKDDYKEKIMELLKENFRPEFLNRIDEIAVFDPLTPDDVEKIVDLQLDQVKKKLAKKGIKLNFNAAARRYISEQGFDPEFGARPVRRAVQRLVLDKLADRIIRGELKHGSRISVRYKEGALVFSS